MPRIDRKPRLLDLFCGAGGCSAGYHRAGFSVTGVDMCKQPNYPFEFFHTDALEFLEENGKDYDVIAASPPCQCYTPLRALHPGKEYPDLLPITRVQLILSGKPWIMENVMTAPMGGVVLCGGMFGLRVYRHRRFASSMPLTAPRHPKHRVLTSTLKGQKCWDAGLNISVTGAVTVSVARLAMGIDWMGGKEISQAIPPSYTEYLGKQVMDLLFRKS
jgi:DNA (cytosine-5)-methyltransferase 1